MAAWVRGTGEPPYPLADACQDHLIGLAIEESTRSGEPVTTAREPWAARPHAPIKEEWPDKPGNETTTLP